MTSTVPARTRGPGFAFTSRPREKTMTGQGADLLIRAAAWRTIPSWGLVAT
ncbi:hypothetical protein [Streptomyces mirabilis]|uniref:hypothetical protein n=1 Tax=Streptomyces mirabilis TaxID=68239 RepID=UPI0036E1BAE0